MIHTHPTGSRINAMAASAYVDNGSNRFNCRLARESVTHRCS